VQSAQVIHAAGESSPGNLPHDTHAVCLTVPDEPSLRSLRTRLEAASARFVSILEEDAPYTGQLMALGFMPVRKEVLRRLLSALPLLK